jgi:competence protein ComEC
LVPVLAALACAVAAWHTVYDYRRLRLSADTDERALVRATLRSLPERSGSDVSVVVDYVNARAAAAAAAGPAPSSTSDLATRRAKLIWHAAPALHVGDTWELLVAVAAPGGLDNPGGVNAERSALRDRLHARLRVQKSRLNHQLSAAAPGIDTLRERIAIALQAHIAERDSAALATALAIGDTREVSPEQWRIYNATGITHLIAISGLHVTLFCLLMSALARRIWQLTPLLQRWRRENFAAGCGVLASTGYALLSGFSVPTQRTLIMLTVWHLMRGLARNSSAVSAIGVAAVLVLLLDPLAPLSAGFWLSFVAVAVLIYATPATGGGELDLKALWQTQWRVAVGLLPVTLAVFGSVSLAGLVVNFIAIPVFSLVLVPLLLAATAALGLWPALAHLLLLLFASLHGWIWPVLSAAANMPMALWRLQPSAWWYVLALPAALLCLLPWRWPQRISAVLALLPAIWPQALLLNEGEYRLTALDVGRSLAVIVQTKEHALLFDNGESWGSAGAMTRSVIIPSLRALGVKRLDVVIVPKLDNDRSTGLVALAAELPIAQLQTGGVEPPPEFKACGSASSWHWNSVDIVPVGVGSCALRVSVPNGPAVLLPAELTVGEQAALVGGASGRAAVVLVPRGGAATGDSAALRAALGARYAVVSNSRRGADTRTVQGTLSAWRDAGATTLLTAEDGAVEVRGSAASLQVHTRR